MIFCAPIAIFGLIFDKLRLWVKNVSVISVLACFKSNFSALKQRDVVKEQYKLNTRLSFTEGGKRDSYRLF